MERKVGILFIQTKDLSAKAKIKFDQVKRLIENGASPERIYKEAKYFSTEYPFTASDIAMALLDRQKGDDALLWAAKIGGHIAAKGGNGSWIAAHEVIHKLNTSLNSKSEDENSGTLQEIKKILQTAGTRLSSASMFVEFEETLRGIVDRILCS